MLFKTLVIVTLLVIICFKFLNKLRESVNPFLETLTTGERGLSSEHNYFSNDISCTHAYSHVYVCVYLLKL
jgi:hypothetical protein